MHHLAASAPFLAIAYVAKRPTESATTTVSSIPSTGRDEAHSSFNIVHSGLWVFMRRVVTALRESYLSEYIAERFSRRSDTAFQVLRIMMFWPRILSRSMGEPGLLDQRRFDTVSWRLTICVAPFSVFHPCRHRRDISHVSNEGKTTGTRRGWVP